MLYTTGIKGDTQVYYFDSKQERIKWFHDVEEFKATFGRLVDKVWDEGLVGKTTLEGDWEPVLTLARNLIAHFGKAYVPKDIRRALLSIEEAHGVTAFTWDD